MRSRVGLAGVLLQVAFRNLFASRARTLIVGGIVLFGAVLVVVGSSLLDSVDRGMRGSIQGSLAGHLQVYSARSKDDLALYGGMTGESQLRPIEDFAALKRVLEGVPNVKTVVPMGIDQALVLTGNEFDVALEKLRADVRRLGAGETGDELRARHEAHKAHVRRMATVLQQELAKARAIVDESLVRERERDREDLSRATSEEFWARFDADPLASLEFLENRIAPQSLDGGFTFIRYAGTDLDAYQQAFDRMRIVEGTAVPRGRRGILLGKLYAEDWLKLKTARRLDRIRDARTLLHERIDQDEELRRWVKENQTQTRDILLQLDPVQARVATERLQRALGSASTDLRDLLVELFTTDDASFDERYRIFYQELAPLLQLYRVRVGDTITIEAPSKSGYMSSVNVKVYGFVEFRGLEKSALAGIMSLMDLMSWRDLYGYVTAEKAAEIEAIKRGAGARDVAREDAEAELFGSPATLVESGRSERIDDPGIVGAAQRKADADRFQALSELVGSNFAGIAAQLQLLAQGKVEQSELQALAALVDARLGESAAQLQAVAAGKIDRPDVPDALYVAFEDRFRGKRDDIIERVSVYLPLLRQCDAGSREAPVLDVGCGRGEWLEALGASGLVARGVDLNPLMIAECRARGFDVVQGGGIDHLRQMAPGSLGALSAIHVIEHLGFNDLVVLLDEARRVLRPGGLLVLETPNPENLVVGACSFYNDPTHRQPLPPEPMRHVARARGFADVEILRLHPATPPERAQSGSDPWSARIDALLYGPQDYAIIARNPA